MRLCEIIFIIHRLIDASHPSVSTYILASPCGGQHLQFRPLINLFRSKKTLNDFEEIINNSENKSIVFWGECHFSDFADLLGGGS